MELTAAPRATRATPTAAARLSTPLTLAALFALSALLLRGWLDSGVPLTPRREMLAQMAWASIAADALRSGHLPSEWSHLFLGGQPWARLLSVPVYLGVGALSLLVGLPGAVKLFYLATFTLSGWTMFGWVRALRVGSGAALVAAAAYIFFPFHAQASADWWEHLLVWALLPLPLWLVERWRWMWTWQRGAALGAALGVLVLANPERAPHNAFFLGLYIATRELPGWRAGRAVAGRNLRPLLLAGLVAVALAAPLLVSTVLSLPLLGAGAMRGPGASLSSDFLRGWSLTPEMLVAATLRRAKFDPPTASLPAIWKAFGGLNAWYLGVGLVGLALLSLLPEQQARGDRRLVPLLWTLVGLALLVGVSPWLPGDPFHLLFARILPYRAIFYLGLFLPPLAALGVARMQHLAASRHWRRPFVASSAIFDLQPAIPALALLLVVADFAPVSASYSTAPAYFGADEVAAYEWLAARQAAEGPWRLWEPTESINAKYQRTLAVAVAPLPRFDGHWDEGVPLPLWQLRHATAPTDPALLDALAVRYALLRPAEPGAAQWQRDLAAAGFDRLAWAQGGVEVWERPAAAPFVQGAAQAEVLAYDPGRIRLRVEIEHNETLVRLAEAWYPDWTVTVNGQPAPLRRAADAFLGVALPPGSHEVEFTWRTPLVLRLAWALVLAVALGLVAIALRGKLQMADRK